MYVVIRILMLVFRDSWLFCFFFFFQAEDGIRDYKVTGVQTCALPISWTGVRAITQFPKVDAIRRPAVALLFILVLQLCLGFAAFLTRVVWSVGAPQPELSMVIATVAHVSVGALLLATTAVLTLQVWRHVPAAQNNPVEARSVIAPRQAPDFSPQTRSS